MAKVNASKMAKVNATGARHATALCIMWHKFIGRDN